MHAVALSKLSSVSRDSKIIEAMRFRPNMKKTNKGLSVRILEKEYQIACTDEERDDLIQAARYLETKLKEIAGKGKIIGSERAAIMAALNISYEMVKSQDIMSQQSSHEKRLEKLQKEVRGVVDKFKQANL